MGKKLYFRYLSMSAEEVVNSFFFIRRSVITISVTLIGFVLVFIHSFGGGEKEGKKGKLENNARQEDIEQLKEMHLEIENMSDNYTGKKREDVNFVLEIIG